MKIGEHLPTVPKVDTMSHAHDLDARQTIPALIDP